MDGQAIYQNFTEGNTSALHTAADQVRTLSDNYRQRLESITGLSDRMMNSWKGDSAAAANAGANPLAQAFADSAGPLDATTMSVTTQATGFDAAGSSVVPVPPAPEKPNPWTTGLKGAIPIAGPFMAANDIQNYQEGMQKHNAANETNVRVMEQYKSISQSTTSALPTNYSVLSSDNSSLTVKDGGKPQVIIEWNQLPPPGRGRNTIDDSTTSSSTETTSSTTSNTTNTTGDRDSTGGSRTTGDTGGGRGDRGGKDTDTTTPTRTKPGDSDTGTGRTDPRRRVPQPTPDTVVGVPGQGGGRNTTTPGVPSTSGTSGGRGGSAAGRLLGGGPGGVPGGPGAGSGALAGGKGTGVGGLGGMDARGGVGAAAAARSGAGMGGPMGHAAGQRGEGEEDSVHQRPDYLIEPDPDGIFGTDQTAIPPVIGE
ncbi:hypothetical protein EWH70_11170 [Amycolatopsis suaedae]|uniref:WXG100 family type VII secretion target n=2 Tax=Amycolatopsis suaedae TaxID=2510978 RepID=A0A4Q7J9S1_9PSEU|nr:hypothetical protein [Amycolatopsis suaedae]RZQ63989.1 hypothetical protein EWH70_11170 [Amycolatopsis suaedae]